MVVKIKQLKGVVVITEKKEHEVIDLYWKIKKNIFRWADDTQENVIEELKYYGLQIMPIREYNRLKVA